MIGQIRPNQMTHAANRPIRELHSYKVMGCRSLDTPELVPRAAGGGEIRQARGVWLCGRSSLSAREEKKGRIFG